MDRELPEDFDALAPEDFDSPYVLYSALRAGCPVAHSRAWGGFWALSRFDDVAAAAADYGTYTTTVQNVVPKLAFTGRRPPLHLDPPEHSVYRRVINPLLNKESVERLEPLVRRHAVALLQPLLARSHGDICGEFGAVLPISVFAEWMNLPAESIDALRETARDFVYAVQTFNAERVKATSYDLYAMARQLIKLRKLTPLSVDNDITTALLAAREDGKPLPDELVVGAVRQILVVGIVAPGVMIGSICVHLSRFPSLQNQLRENPALIPAAIEEFLRLYTPYRGFARTPTRDIELHGVKIRKDEAIALMYASANRDDTVFPQAHEFILNRPNINEHLAFGRGPHHCPGAWLARLELRVAFEEILSRTRHFAVDGPIQTTLCPEIGALRVPLRVVASSNSPPSPARA